MNEWSGPHKSAFGEHIVFVKDISAGFLPPLEKVISSVQQDYLTQAQDEAVAKYIDEIRSEYSVVINPNYKF